MSTLITPQNIMFIIGIIGMMFSLFLYFKNPQIDSDKRDALLDQSVKNNTESVDRRFKEIQDNFQGLLLQNNNHIHTLDTKIDAMGNHMTNLKIEVAKLATIIEERIPRKT